MESRPSSHPVYSFGPFRVDFENCEIQKHGIRLRMQNLPAQVLRRLVEQPGQLITRQRLQEELWPGASTNEIEDSLNSTVKKLRETLGDDPGRPIYIETIPRKGYRFVAPVQVAASQPLLDGESKGTDGSIDSSESVLLTKNQRPAGRLWWRHRWGVAAGFALVLIGVTVGIVLRFSKRAAADSQIHSIAVLPFENLSGDTQQNYFAEGLTDAVTTDLAQLGSVKVISRSSASHYQKDYKPISRIREELGVDAVVEGTVTRAGGKIRVNAQLISTGDDHHLWAQAFERDEGDIVSLQDDLAQSVATRIQAAITPEQRKRLSEAHPVNVEAYKSFLNGMHDLNTHRSNAELQRSLEEFDRATDLDSQLAIAYAGKALAYNLLGDYDALLGKEAGPKAEEAARRALAADDSLPSAHSALAFALWKYKWNWSEADAAYQKSLTLNPNNANTHHGYALFLACQGEFGAAEEHMRTAQALDPLSLIIRTNTGWLRYFQRDYAKAESVFEEVLKVDPGFLVARQKLWIAYALDGKAEQAGTELENVLGLLGHQNLLDRVKNVVPSGRYLATVRTYVESGVLSPYERARLLALLGRKSEAIQALNEAAGQQSSWMVYLGIEPTFDGMRKMPEFAALEQRVNVPPTAEKMATR